MPLPPTAELVCSFTTIKTEPLNPFVWLLLKTLISFSSGNRPDFGTLAEKLAFQDVRYLHQAWDEAERLELCESGANKDLILANETSFLSGLHRSTVVYDHAKVTVCGKQALQDGFVRIGNPRKRIGETLYLLIRDGSHVEWRNHFEPKVICPLDIPKWANKVNAKLISDALLHQRESTNDHIQPEEQIFDLEIHWEESRRVKLD